MQKKGSKQTICFLRQNAIDRRMKLSSWMRHESIANAMN